MRWEMEDGGGGLSTKILELRDGIEDALSS